MATQDLESGAKLKFQTEAQEAITWWEARRWNYNLFVIGFQVILLIVFFSDGPIPLLEAGQALSCFLLTSCILNLFYFAGWGIEILTNYYFSRGNYSESLRYLLFFLGTVVALIGTIFLLALTAILLYAL